MASSPGETINILVINPNSSNLSLEFYTAPSGAPPSIDDEETSTLSTSANLPALLPLLNPSTADAQSHGIGYSGYLAACFSPHPLTPLLRERTPAPVLNIFEAALLQARALSDPFGIVTTGQYWEAVLEEGVRDFFCGKHERNEREGGSNAAGFVGVRSTGLSAIQLHSTRKDEVFQRLADASAELVGKGARSIILGCAGMSGMEDAVREGARRHEQQIKIFDGVRAGVVLLEGLVKTRSA